MSQKSLRMLFFALLCVAALTTVQTVASNAGGAPANTAKDGCSCHGGASGEAKVGLQAPTEFVPGGVYDLKITVDGPPALPSPAGMNVGGFALEVSAGLLSGGTGVRAEGTFATHTSSGNDRRSWDLKWTAPENVAEVTFYMSANAVNGDQIAGELDRWNKVAPIAKARAVGTNGSGPPNSAPADSTSALAWGFAAGVLVAVAVVQRRRV